ARFGAPVSYGPGCPVAVQRKIPMPRRLVFSVEGSWPCQLISLVTLDPNMASGWTPSSPKAVASITAVAPTITSGSRSISGAPDNEAAATNVSGWRAAYVVEPKPPWESPAIARPRRSATVRRLASTHGMSWDTWKVSHLDGPFWVAVSTQLVNQLPPSPLKPASGMTVIRSSG